MSVIIIIIIIDGRVGGKFQRKKMLNFHAPRSIGILFNLQPISFRLNKVLNGKYVFVQQEPTGCTILLAIYFST
jgi:hypothetical protein